MRKYSTGNLGEDCGIQNLKGSLKIAWAVTDKILDKETLHYHSEGYEYYFFVSGEARMKVGEDIVEVKSGDVIEIEPGEPHKLVEIMERAKYIVVNTVTDHKDKVIL